MMASERPSVEKQLEDVYGLIDELQTVEQRLRAAVDTAMNQLREDPTQ